MPAAILERAAGELAGLLAGVASNESPIAAQAFLAEAVASKDQLISLKRLKSSTSWGTPGTRRRRQEPCLRRSPSEAS